MTPIFLADSNGGLGAGFIAFLVVLALVIASFFLFRSMSRHLKKVPASFDSAEETDEK
jgi:hypothetical protein